MNAAKARELSNENKISFEKLLIDITESAKAGFDQISLMTIPTDECKLELMNRGFNITNHKDQIGLTSLIISW